MSDHKAEAERIMTEPGYGFSEGNDPHGAAQVHATLYLAEQQRIANLIAWHDGSESPEEHGQLLWLIREGLGIS